MERAKTQPQETNPNHGQMFVLPCKTVCVQRGGEEDAVMREELGAVVVLRKNDEETSSCSPAVSGPRCSRCFLPMPASNCAAGSGELPGFSRNTPTYLGKSEVAQPASLHPSLVPQADPAGTLPAKHCHSSAPSVQVTKLGVTGEKSLPGI